MEIQEAIEFLKEYADWVRELNRKNPDTMGIAIDTVLEELGNYKNTIEIIEELGRITKNKLTISEYTEIHSKECAKYNECKPECHFWGLCEDKTIPIANINSAVYTAEKIKEGAQ